MVSPFPAVPGAAVPGAFTPGDPGAVIAAVAPGLPQIKVEVAFGATGGALTWRDISTYVRSGSIARPTSRLVGPLYQFQAGTCSLVLKNGDGRFDPDNLSGPYITTSQQVTQTFTSAGAHSVTIPSTLVGTTVVAECWGGGGGGGGATANNRAGKGGGGGEYAKGNVTVTAGNTYTATVGAGGTPGSTAGSDGANGGTSNFTGDGVSQINGHGGQGGAGNLGSTSKTTTPGGTGSTAPTHFNGGAGGGCFQSGSTQSAGGGGGSAGTASAGQAGQTPTTGGGGALGGTAVPGGGPGGGTFTGIGGDGSPPPSGPGGGGGGASAGNTNAHKGGKGWAGQIHLTYTVTGATTTQVLPMVPVRVTATWNGVSYPLFYGYADSWQDAGINNPRYAEVTLSATDAYKVLSNISLPAITAAGAGDDSGDRINRILDSAGWPSNRRQVDAGDSTPQATTYGDTALNLMQLTSDSEMGDLYVNGSGSVVFRHRGAIFNDARSVTPQAVFGDSPGTAQAAGTELPYVALARAYDDTTLVNDVQITRVGGTLQESQDAGSESKFLFPRSYSRTDLIISTDAEALSYAKLVRFIAQDAEDRFEGLGVNPLRAPASLYPQALGREIGDRIQIWRRAPNVAAFSKDCFIRGVQHDWSVPGNSWLTTWTLQVATRYNANAPTY